MQMLASIQFTPGTDNSISIKLFFSIHSFTPKFKMITENRIIINLSELRKIMERKVTEEIARISKTFDLKLRLQE